MQPELEARKQSQVDAEPQPTSLADLKKLPQGYSAKSGAVVRAAKAILNANPADKILVFSAWTSMLDVLQRALTENNISCAQVGSGKKFQEAIDLFKDAQKKVTVLLLPVARGSKGLNLTEARHVFLIEPILNPASELQALGRVHRIGQDKETEVHRFLVRGTVEERLHAVLSHAKGQEELLTLRDLYDMFASRNSANPATETEPEEQDQLN
ncbi:E3 ubiquitin-protein ligase SHPRH-like [Cloeon dipterum]|uniref:E3 ubiquitin-protein ligase SHPRH-like n=1 Tax=Cloeon dipterum TaxID=197152 RepID=UPI0032208ABC